MGKFTSTKLIELGSSAFRQPFAESHCKFVHGYQLKAKVWLTCDELDNKNWVFDFGSFKEIKANLEKTFDHKLIISKDDPAKSVFRELERYGAVDLVVMDGVGIEKFAEHVFSVVDTFVKFSTNNRVWCEKVEVFEHERNSAIYENQKAITNEVETPKIEEVAEKKTVEVKEPEPAPLHNPTSTVTPSTPNSNAAAFGNKVTTGWSNPFAGTSWGV